MKEQYLDFVKKVTAMRNAQKAYFKARRQGHSGAAVALDQSKQLEREVDAMIASMSQEEANQMSLFNQV
jgi:hypothetical protein